MTKKRRKQPPTPMTNNKQNGIGFPHQDMDGEEDQDGFNQDDYDEQIEGRDLNRFLEDQNRYEQEKKMKKERLMLEEVEKAARNQGPKMNAMSRKILERKQRGESENNNATDAADK